MSNSKTQQDMAGSEADIEAWSALVDGELDGQALQDLLADDAGADEAMARWHRYHVIGDVLRGSTPPVTALASGDFLAGVRRRLQQEAPAWQQPQAASVPESLTQAAAVAAADVSRPSANESVFRWKLLAGLASLTAVMAVSWGVLGALTTPGAAPQLAEAAPAAAPAVVAQTPAQAEGLVVIQTGQGALIRDPQLQALLAEHRQHGGMSALQMPAGFLRNATFDAPSR